MGVRRPSASPRPKQPLWLSLLVVTLPALSLRWSTQVNSPPQVYRSPLVASSNPPPAQPGERGPLDYRRWGGVRQEVLCVNHAENGCRKWMVKVSQAGCMQKVLEESAETMQTQTVQTMVFCPAGGYIVP